MSDLIFEHTLPQGRFTVYSQKPNFPLREVKQVHGKVVLDIQSSTENTEADGIYMSVHALDNQEPLAIKTADCIPICVLGEHGVAMLHAGWRGVQQKIMTTSEVQKLNPFYFYLGPSIQKQSFKVTEEFYNHFPEDSEFFGPSTFDLQGVTRKYITSVFPHAKIEWSSIDTFTDERFHSFRRNQTKERNWNLYST